MLLQSLQLELSEISSCILQAMVTTSTPTGAMHGHIAMIQQKKRPEDDEGKSEGEKEREREWKEGIRQRRIDPHFLS